MKVYTIVGTLLLLLFLAASIRVQTVRAPELFGIGTMYQIGNYAMIVRSPFVFAMTVNPCTIVQVAGPQIEGAERPISCRVGVGRWRGWIDFRGHARPFCGARTAEELPRKCRGEQ